ncbi:Cyclin subunit, putative, partial [Candida maltosa Xu316]
MLPQLKQLNDVWIFSEDAVLNHTPARAQKIPLEQELKMKEALSDFLIRLGSALRIDGRTILAATVYLHRYYMRTQISNSKYNVVSAALTISGKLNDNYRPPEKVASYACHIRDKVPLNEHNEIYWAWRDQLLFREELILRKLNFDLNLVLPYSLRDSILKNCYSDELMGMDKVELLKKTVSLIESLSSLPVILCYHMNVIFGTAMIIVKLEFDRQNKEKENENLPNGFLKDYLNTDSDACCRCFRFIKKLLGICQADRHGPSNKALIKRILVIESEKFANAVKFGDYNDDNEKLDASTNGSEVETKKIENGENDNSQKTITNEDVLPHGEKRKNEDLGNTSDEPETKVPKTE